MDGLRGGRNFFLGPRGGTQNKKTGKNGTVLVPFFSEWGAEFIVMSLLCKGVQRGGQDFLGCAKGGPEKVDRWSQIESLPPALNDTSLTGKIWQKTPLFLCHATIVYLV